MSVNHQRLSFCMSFASLINWIQWKCNRVYIFQFLNWENRFIYNNFCTSGPTHPALKLYLICLVLEFLDCFPHGGPLGSLWGNLLFNLKTHSPCKCFPHCPLESIKEILPLVSTIFGICLMLYELCPPIWAFQCSHLCDLCRKECCLQRGRNLIQSNPPCDFIIQGTKIIVLQSTNESSQYCSLCWCHDQHITCDVFS